MLSTLGWAHSSLKPMTTVMCAIPFLPTTIQSLEKRTSTKTQNWLSSLLHSQRLINNSLSPGLKTTLAIGFTNAWETTLLTWTTMSKPLLVNNLLTQHSLKKTPIIGQQTIKKQAAGYLVALNLWTPLGGHESDNWKVTQEICQGIHSMEPMELLVSGM